jgi:hypothetical protein
MSIKTILYAAALTIILTGATFGTVTPAAGLVTVVVGILLLAIVLAVYGLDEED